jgi:succinate-acetate transporter protein
MEQFFWGIFTFQVQNQNLEEDMILELLQKFAVVAFELLSHINQLSSFLVHLF